ncbi:unnamed protein product [Pieris macdunnoughi]|uniref:Uncharacterized protein n=1 Tax=Pieris macdunnoughi TaxID=345717 RepID=A0A821RPG0_9NEOP|nr:unnamed protein product [Pieris macdunnoughi]
MSRQCSPNSYMEYVAMIQLRICNQLNNSEKLKGEMTFRASASFQGGVGGPVLEKEALVGVIVASIRPSKSKLVAANAELDHGHREKFLDEELSRT